MPDVGVFSPLVLLMMMLMVNYQQRMDDVGTDETGVFPREGDKIPDPSIGGVD